MQHVRPKHWYSRSRIRYITAHQPLSWNVIVEKTSCSLKPSTPAVGHRRWVGIGGLSPALTGRDVNFTTHLHLALRFSMNGSMPLSPHTPSWRWNEKLSMRVYVCVCVCVFVWLVGVLSVWQGSACHTDNTPTQPHRNSNTHRNKNTQPMWWYNRKVAGSSWWMY